MGNQRYITNKECQKCHKKTVEYTNAGNEEIETCLSCGFVQEDK